MNKFWWVLGGLLAIAGFFILLESGVFVKERYGVKYQDADRHIFKSTQSFVDGKIAILTKAKLEYTMAKEEDRPALRTFILAEAATVDRDKLPADLQSFLHSLEGGVYVP